MYLQTVHRRTMPLFCAAILCGSSLLGGCSKQPQNRAELEQAANLFFESVNHLFESDAMAFEGEFTMMGSDLPYQAAIITDPAQISLSAGWDADNPLIAFYLKDGKTYLNSMGTKTSSVAENIGLPSNGKLTLTNPFNELSRQDRLALFDAVSVNGNTYTFTVNPNELAKFLDSYGAVTIEKATLTAGIEDTILSDVSIDLKGTYAVDKASTALDFNGSLHVTELGDKVQIVFPDDLASYTTE